MRINITDSQIQQVLDLTSTELARLLRFQSVDPKVQPFQIVSPALIVCGERKYEVELLAVEERSVGVYSADSTSFYYPSKSYMTRPTTDESKVPPFNIKITLTQELYQGLCETVNPLLLFRVQNSPSYSIMSEFRAEFKSPGKPGELRVPVNEVKTVTELLKTQLTESAFYEVYIIGRSEDFFESSGKSLDDLVSLIGIKRKIEENDTELRLRVKDYLKIRLAGTTNVTDEELYDVVKKAEEVQEIERAMDAAKGRGENEKKERPDS